MRTEIIPVIHMLNENQVITNVRTCIECGIKKVFIINHVVTIPDLIKCSLRVKSMFPDLWVGINMLGNPTEESLLMDIKVDGLWCDSDVKESKYFLNKNFKGQFFGGLAFKYQPQPKDLEVACGWASKTTDVATTSGPGTGREADIIKILTIRKYLGDHPMAIASGVSINNINSYKNIVDYLLVASSITSRSEMIDKDKLMELVSAIN